LDGISITRQWGDVKPIGGELPPVRPFELDLHPEALRSWVGDIADRMQVPPDAPAACGVVALGGCVNRRALIQPKRADTVFKKAPKLWGAIVLPSGQMKSPVMQCVTRPTARIEDKWRLEYERGLIEYKHQKELAEIERSAWREVSDREIKKGSPTPDRPNHHLQEPIMRGLIITDRTVEKLNEIMWDNPTDVLMIRDELTGWLAELRREGREGQLAFCLSAWNGDSSFTVDRIGRGSIYVPACCLGILGGIQPSRLRSYLVDAWRDGSAYDGLLQRFQVLAWPDTATPWKLVDRAPNGEAEARVWKATPIAFIAASSRPNYERLAS
jgi:putative DNA primase/helicase